MMGKFVAAAMAAFAATAACAQPAPPPSPVAAGAPKLLLVISIDQFSADLFEEYRPNFTGGLARLAKEGVLFRNGFQSHAATETCPGHSTILTGNRPSRTRIIANSWASRSPGENDFSIYCMEDESRRGETDATYQTSSVHLATPALGEIMRAVWPTSRVVAVAGKDRSAVLMSGHDPSQRWYWSSDRFATDVKGAAVPATVAAMNRQIANLLARPSPPLQPPPLCSARSQVFKLEGSGREVGAGAFARGVGDTRALRASPQLDGAVLAIAAGLIAEMGLGKAPTPDLLAIGLSSTDLVGHTFGTGGQEMCLQLLSLDRDLGDFFQRLDSWGLDYEVVVTADHGGEDIPERLRAKGLAEAQRVDPNLASAIVGKQIADRLGLTGPMLRGEFGNDVYIDPALSAVDRKRVTAEAKRIYAAHSQVAAVFTADELKAAPMPSGPPDQWPLLARARASYDPERSGDLIVLLKRHVTPIVDTQNYAATHGSAWDYDRRVPIIFWKKGRPAAERTEAIETVDIMPTLAALLGVSLKSGAVDGKCLQGIPRITCGPR